MPIHGLDSARNLLFYIIDFEPLGGSLKVVKNASKETMNEGFVTRIKNCHFYITIASQEREGRCQYSIEKYIMNKTLFFAWFSKLMGILLTRLLGRLLRLHFKPWKGLLLSHDWTFNSAYKSSTFWYFWVPVFLALTWGRSQTLWDVAWWDVGPKLMQDG